MTLDKHHREITEAYSRYLLEYEAFHVGGKKVAAARARKALADLGKLAKSQRAAISAAKNKMKGGGTAKRSRKSSTSDSD